MFWNAQSITSTSKRVQFEYAIFKEKIDIVLIVETYLKPIHAFELKGYNTYRNDRLHQAHGGVAIAIRNGLSHKLIHPIATNIIENIGIEITINHTPTNIFVAYSPKHKQNFLDDVEALTSSNNQFMLFGDLNAKHTAWNCNVNNKAGNELFTLQQNNDFLIHHTADHTHYPHSGQTPSTIDILLSNVNFAFDFYAYPDQISSDHKPTICNVSESIALSFNTRFEYSKANWRKYRQTIELEVKELPIPISQAEIDRLIEYFTNMILNARSESVPTIVFNNKPQITSFTKQLIQFKNNMIRQMQRTPDDNVKRTLKTTINALQKEINNQVTADVNDCWNKKLSGISKGGKKLWKLSKEFKGKTDSNANKIKIDSSQTANDSDRANLLADIFEKAHTTTATFTHENDRIVRQTIHSFNAFSFIRSETPIVSVEEIRTIIKSMRPFKSPGPDSIQNILLKNLPAAAIEWLTHLFSKCLELSIWPSNFKIAKVIPILKSGKSPYDAHSYRPISLLNAIGKILEKIVHSRLISIIEEKNLLPPVQFGFRKGHSTIHQAMRIKQFIAKNKEINKSTGMILLDIEKAFDSVWHDGLIYKLIKMKLPSYLIRIINAFIRNRQFEVYVNNGISRKISIPAGLAQGTCISPILYALFIADMPNIEKIESALYADDTAILTAAKRSNTIVKRLNSALLILKAYFHKWKIKMNETKTQAIIFPFNRKRIRKPSIPLLNGQHTLEINDSVNYLGLTFDKMLLFGQHIANTVNKTNKCFRALYPMISAKSQLSTSNKVLLFTAVLRPIMSYGCPVWFSAAITHINKLNVMQNKIVKTIFKLPKRTPTIYVKDITGFDQFNSFIELVNTKFLLSCSNSNFDLIREIEIF